MQPYTITIESDFAEFWRYNLALAGEVKAEGERVEYLKLIDDIAPVGANLTAMPEGYDIERKLSLCSKAGDSLILYIYVVPNTIPTARRVEECAPFELKVSIHHGHEQVHLHRYMRNQWSGDNIEIKLEA